VPALLRLVHPFPSALNAALVFGIALLAGATADRAAWLAIAMLGLQFCIGTVNDLFDEALDAQSKPHKPIPAGEISRQTAWIVALASGGGALVLALLVRPPDLLPIVMVAAMLGAGLVYDAFLKPTAFGWVCFAVAFPILPLYAWYGATGMLPPRWEVLVPVAALAGLALQLANGLIDLVTDQQAGARTLTVSLGRRNSVALMAACLFVIHALAWLTASANALPVVGLLSGVAGAFALGGVMASAQQEGILRQIGWTAQTASIAVLAFAWLLDAATVGRPV
jgi:4-hydroxybenzoate polyprenyltransferase